MIPNIPISDFTYDLPDEAIARFPLTERDQSKLLLYKAGQINEDKFCNLSNYLQNTDTLVFNNTKVIHARLIFKKSTGARIEVFCLEPVTPKTFEQVLTAQHSCVWKCTVGNLKKWKDEDLLLNVNIDGITDTLSANKLEMVNGDVIVRFTWNSSLTFGQIMEHCGAIPIPPYLKRASEELDSDRYQTVYSKLEGSVAAPTAGLHFTPNVIKLLKDKPIDMHELTLHVGAGTFKPVKAEFIADHAMHTEHFIVSLDVLNRLMDKAGNIVAVGTTSVRMLESIYWLGINILNNKPLLVSQWQPYERDEQTTVTDAFTAVRQYMAAHNLSDLYAATQIMIVPGYRFRMIKGLLTNFHQPQSTLLLLITALIGNDWKKVYGYALKNNFRFLSYGDSSLLLP